MQYIKQTCENDHYIELIFDDVQDSTREEQQRACVRNLQVTIKINGYYAEYKAQIDVQAFVLFCSELELTCESKIFERKSVSLDLTHYDVCEYLYLTYYFQENGSINVALHGEFYTADEDGITTEMGTYFQVDTDEVKELAASFQRLLLEEGITIPSSNETMKTLIKMRDEFSRKKRKQHERERKYNSSLYDEVTKVIIVGVIQCISAVGWLAVLLFMDTTERIIPLSMMIIFFFFATLLNKMKYRKYKDYYAAVGIKLIMQSKILLMLSLIVLCVFAPDNNSFLFIELIIAMIVLFRLLQQLVVENPFKVRE